MSKRLISDQDSVKLANCCKKPRTTMLEISDYENWNVDDVHDFFEEKLEGDLSMAGMARTMKEQKIRGKDLEGLTEELLQKMGCEFMGDRLQILGIVKTLLNSAKRREVSCSFNNKFESDFKVFNDPIHGHIELPALCVSIMDTPQFQRLRYIKQLGGCYFVFPGASHNRFEHSIGVSHLAGELVRNIRSRQPELNITDEDILCVQIAGLCHDLGHGPFSHMFDGLFIPTVRPDYKWQHEKASADMFDYLVESNNLVPQFDNLNLTGRDRTFIKEQIAGPVYREKNKVQKWLYEGRDENKSFLYEIVANKRNGVDVDKWDYFARDCHHLGISSNFDHSRFMKFCRVIQADDGQMQICNRDKEVGNIYDMFYTRSVLHRRAYQHKTSNIIELMICEAFEKANAHIRIEGKNRKMCKISECVNDVVAYTKLTDNIYHQILYSCDPKLVEAQKILNKIEKRDLYKCVGQTKPVKSNAPHIQAIKIPEMRNEIARAMVNKDNEPALDPNDVIVTIVNIDYGKKDQNPIDSVRFYSKASPNTAITIRKEQVSHMLPEKFSDQYIRVYSRRGDKDSINTVLACFKQWCKTSDMVEPKVGDMYSLEMTPLKLSPAKYPSVSSVRTALDFNEKNQ